MDEHLDRQERQYLEVELYEKIVVRERRKKAILISLAFIVFMFLCGIPVYQERFPKWQSLKAAREIAVEIESLKTESLHLKKPLQLSVLENGQFKIEIVSHCKSSPSDETTAEQVRADKTWKDESTEITLLTEEDAKKLKLNSTVHQICFDPVLGMNFPKVKKVLVLVPVKDLAESRLDRASYIEVESTSARISIN